MIKTSDDLLNFMAEILTKEQTQLILEKARNLAPTDGEQDVYGMARMTLASILNKISKASGKEECDWFGVFYEMRKFKDHHEEA